MTENSAIQWTDHTFNPWIGCTHVSPGCVNCYAEVNTFTRAQRARGRELWGAGGARHVVSEAKWREVKKWNAEASASRRRTLVFCASMADIFEDRRDLDDARARLWSVIEMTPALTWQLLTKRPENADKLTPGYWVRYGWPKNVWAMTTCEDQERADLRIPQLLRIPARVHGVSYEPAIEAVDFKPGLWAPTPSVATCRFETRREVGLPGIDWLIVGGESGSYARPFDLAWARSAVAQCKAAGVAVFVKQLGARPYRSRQRDDGKVVEAWDEHLRLGDRKGADMAEWPTDLRVREFPG